MLEVLVEKIVLAALALICIAAIVIRYLDFLYKKEEK